MSKHGLTDADFEAAIAASEGGLEAELMKEKDWRRDLWDSYGPGKYDDYAGAYVDEFVGNGFADKDIGDVETTNAYSLVKGPFHHPSLKGQAGAILEYTDQGFVHNEFFSSKKELEKKWKEIEEYVSEAEGEAGGEDY